MSKKLLIVESPAKAKTIEKFLGADFSVRSSVGHIRDLEKGTDLGVDVNNNYKPNYVISPDKAKLVKELREAAKKADEVWLATDEDREGEAISWHLCEVLGLDAKSTKRIVFHEITKSAIQKAVLNPRTVDLNLVDAQQARRILDRLVGWELSGLLWKKVKGQLSAGRVQSVTVKLVVEREKEINAFESSNFFKITAHYLEKNQQAKIVTLHAERPDRLTNATEAQAFLERCKGASYTVKNIEVKPTKRKPAAPFTTSTLQQEASRKLGFSVSRTMSNAQKLYEQGFISYMRTDSTNLSDTALQEIEALVIQNYGAKYHHFRKYKNSNDSAQEAHEAIRPSYFDKMNVSNNRDEQRLYELIWKRTMASQMADAELEKTIVDIGISTQANERLVAQGEVLKFDGFLAVYMESSDDEEDEEQAGILPPLAKGQVLNFNEMIATERFTKALPRYTEAGLVKKLEELGIGRPSTYAPTITKIMEDKRGYVVKESREGENRTFKIMTLSKEHIISQKTGSEKTGAVKNVLFPTDMGVLVSNFLDDHFHKIMEYGFTAGIEKQFDHIAEGKLKWPVMIDGFYKPFHQLVESTLKDADRVSGERILGKDPESGKTILVRMSKLGKPVVQIGTGDELVGEEKPRYANLRPGVTLDNINLEDALSCFALPRTLGEYEGAELSVNSGRYGPYVKMGDAFVSLPRGMDPYEMSLEQAITLIEAKNEADRPIGHYKNLPITKGKGRFGPFVKWTDLYINVPKAINFDTINEAQAIQLVEGKIDKEANRYIQQWPEESISIERGRWGAYIRFKKDMLKVMKLGEDAKPDDTALLTISLDDVKKMIVMQMPNAFKVVEKKTPAKKPAATKKK